MAVPFSENGGFNATTFFLFMPTIASDTGRPTISIFDPSSFDDPDDAASYSWKAEDIVIGRVPIVRRALLVYTDLGLATITVTVTGTDDNNKQISSSKVIQIGTIAATGLQMTKLVDVTLACFRPQLSITRVAGAGPISIVSASLIGEYEEVTL